MKLLHVDSSITGEQSVSRLLTQSIINELVRTHPTASVARRDLAIAPLAHLELSALSGDSEEAITTAVVLDEFLGADIVVLGAPMYNFTIPSQLKAWLDRLLIQGKTFRYTDAGPEGLAAGRRVIVAVSSGGFYRAQSPSAPNEHFESYLRGTFRFIGIEPDFIVAEGVAVSSDHRAKAIEVAKEAIAGLVR